VSCGFLRLRAATGRFDGGRFYLIPAGVKGNTLNQTTEGPELLAAGTEPDASGGEREDSDPYARYENQYDLAPAFQSSPKTQRRKAVTSRRRAQIASGLGDPKKDTEIVFTFKAARFEEEWLLGYLKVFYDDQLITDVLREVKGGKEANVYCCRAHPRTGYDLLAVKVYRPRRLRNLRNDAQYRAGRNVLDDQGKRVQASREQRALGKKTRFGRELLHGSWLAHEYANLQLLHAAGVDVPMPIAQSENAILMEYLGDADEPAPALNQVSLTREEAPPLFERLMHNVSLMLDKDRIHGDLSAYNVLYWDGAVKIIDFPQSVDPFQNPDAFELFSRDVERLCQYFAHCGIQSDAPALARQLWQEHTLARADINL
jgi:RIO kinase 1